MSRPDIYLRDGRTTAVESLEVATGRDAAPDVRVDPNTAGVDIGGGGGEFSDGALRLRDRGGDARINLSARGSGEDAQPSNTRVRVDGSNGQVQLGEQSTAAGESDITLLPGSSFVDIGGGGAEDADGQLFVNDRDGDQRIQLIAGGGGPASATSNRIFLDGSNGELRLGASWNDENNFDVRFLPRWATMRLGGGAGENSDGDIVMEDREATERIHVDAGGGGPTSGEPRVYVAGGEMDPQDARDATRDHPVTVLGETGLVTLGGDGEAGRLDLNEGGSYDTVTLDGGEGRLSLGGAPRRSTGTSGSVTLYNSREVGTVGLDAASGTVEVGSQGYRGTDRGAQSGAVRVIHASGETTAELRGDEGGVFAGGAGEAGSLMLKNADGEPVGLLEADGDELVLSSGDGTPVLRIGQGGSVDFPQGGP